MAMLHRPLFWETTPEETVKKEIARVIDKHRESIWISYFNLKQGKHTSLENAKFTSHHCLAHPMETWENLKIGGGGPPILTKHGWLMVYHGVQNHEEATKDKPTFCYAAGVMILSAPAYKTSFSNSRIPLAKSKSVNWINKSNVFRSITKPLFSKERFK